MLLVLLVTLKKLRFYNKTEMKVSISIINLKGPGPDFGHCLGHSWFQASIKSTASKKKKKRCLGFKKGAGAGLPPL